MDVFNFIRGTYGKATRELIFSPAGGRQIHNGRPHMYSGITRAMHFDHVHWAYRHGGPVRSFDRGGVLWPGVNTVVNRTGRPEPVAPTAGRQVTVAAGAVQIIVQGSVSPATIPQLRAGVEDGLAAVLRELRTGSAA